MASYLITGCSRGLGLGLATLLVSKSASEVSKVFACARRETDALKRLIEESAGRVKFVELEVTSEQSVKNAANIVEQTLNGKGLDFLINNAGIMNYTPGGIEDMRDLEDTFKINAVGVHYVTLGFLPLLRKGKEKKIINISTTLGSIGLAPSYMTQPTPAYKISKAALNMLTVQYAQTLESEKFTVAAICPGWVKTDLGTDAAHITVEQSVKGILEIVEDLDITQTGTFLTVNVPGWKFDGRELYDGSCRPW